MEEESLAGGFMTFNLIDRLNHDEKVKVVINEVRILVVQKLGVLFDVVG